MGFIVAFIGTVLLTELLGNASESNWRRGAFAFAPTVLPIAVAYEIAHNYPFVLGSGGRLPEVVWSFLDLGHGPTFDLL